MAELVAGAFLSSFLQVAFERLASHDFLDYFRLRKMDVGLLTKLRVTLISVNKIMEDAEERQYRDRYVKQWLDELKDEVFNAQDLLDDIATEALRQKLHAESQTAASGGKVRGFFTSLVNRNQSEKNVESGIKRQKPDAESQPAASGGKVRGFFTSLVDRNQSEKNVESGIKRQKLDAESQTAANDKVQGFFTLPVNLNQSENKIESGIKEVINNLENLMKQNEILGLREGPSAGIESGGRRSVHKRLPTTRLIDESDMYGRDADKERIVELLLSQTKGGNHQLPMDVIAITGMGGMGKTTLATLVFEDVRTKDQFDHRAWVCVSEGFDVHHVTKATLQSLNCPTEQLHDLHSYQLKLKETLMGKKFFLVLDDVWNENCAIWEAFQAPLKHAAPQSKILVTTRHQKVAKVMRCTFMHSLKPLEDAYSWNLFAKHAFNNQHRPADSNLMQIGREIINKCGGLPLAIKTLGSLLYGKHSFQDWDEILKSDLWELSENDSNIIPSLRLSYHYLPSNLKRCFVYCSIFPKDYNIDKNVLIQLWMADGLICPTQKNTSLEKAGNVMFNDLESRSFFEPSRRGDDYFTMHDLVNDLAKSVTGEFFVQQEGVRAQDMSTKTRYFSYISKISEEVFKCHQLRTFLLLDAGTFSSNYSDVDIMSRLSQLKYIRALSLRGDENGSKNWIDGISNMKHLHYLDLSWTLVKELPNSMGLLINLQTLKLRGCEKLTKLPSNFYKLVNLRHLDLKDCPNIESLPPLGQLPSLQELTIERLNGIKVIGEEFYGNGSSIAPFPQLSYLEISGMEQWEEWDICYEGESFPCLEELHLYQCFRLKKSLPQHLPCLKTLNIYECKNLKATLPKSSCMEKLSLSFCEKIRVKDMPTWSSSDVLPPLHDLELIYCLAMESLPQGGMLSSLQRLSIGWCSSKLIESGRDWGLHELLSLKQLEIRGNEDMECFPEEGLLPPNLQSLSFSCCDNMKRINHRGLVHLHSLTSLSFASCRSMSFEGMPEDGLPPSLSHLSIRGNCPLLKERCEKEKGPDWPIIAHIPRIDISPF